MECSTLTTLALRRHTIGLHVVCVTDNESAGTHASWTSVLKHCTCKNPSRKCRSSGCLEMTRIRQDICHARKVVRKTCYKQSRANGTLLHARRFVVCGMVHQVQKHHGAGRKARCTDRVCARLHWEHTAFRSLVTCLHLDMCTPDMTNCPFGQGPSRHLQQAA